jgi:hypothetical protein
MSKEQKTTQELTEEYMDQSMPSASHITYTPPEGKYAEKDPHIGGPGCYDCCGYHCCIELVSVLVVVLICCAYGTDGTCCDYCYWPF